ncbi:PTS system mannose/fructose/sorbose family transporter subunit IID [Thermoanaerobacter siderophilus]|uniref:Phosphotransferase system, mannose/fructose/N-acetylgalactosamine-specific component IID n=1 Tax=Thermoanaerobacter siderophilus SR4 TaxID=880478 RepID=I9KRD8_9THEO|nr:PTS system mannose/fructose/sorbose family transporter subunit IID [Thermoanaerobacter siderophilus]EIV99433.1 phosphotransferase system, mannose/fructose/N-acetylgalactosamine-specific component IID [Thermoanaerobacter siderophilus SR4]
MNNKLTRKDIIKAWIRWFFFAQSNYNYERLQATAFAHSMLPVIQKLYTKKDEAIAAAKRHLAFFNTEPVVGSVIHGITIAMEEEKANGEPISDEAINGIKVGLMGPLAGIGDTLTQGIITPLMLAITIGITMNKNILGPILFVVGQYVILTSISFGMWMNGYKYGRKAVEDILKGGIINKVVEGASILGTFVMGGLVGRFVTLTTPIAFKINKVSFSLQKDLFDKIMPGLLPLALTFSVFYLVKKGISPIKIMGYLLIIAVAGGILGIF